jgi:selenide,water dikinase
MRRLVLAGGGHAHVEVLRRFGLQSPGDVEVVLVSPGRYAAYSGMLPGLVAGHYGFEQAHIDLERLARFARAQFVRDVAVRLDVQRRVLVCDSGLTVTYDVLSLDIGAAPTALLLGRGTAPGVPVKPVETYLAQWDQAVQAARQRPLDILVVGGGAGGVEITLAMQHRLQQVAPRNGARFTLVTLGREILPGHASGVRGRMQRTLAARGVQVRVDSRVVAHEGKWATLQSGERLAADFVFSATGAEASRWLAEAGLATDDEGFVLVEDTLQSCSHPAVFAAGDCATMRNHKRPRSGVYAVRQGPPLAENLRNRLVDRPLQPYLPQPRALYLISTGNRYAIASYGRLSIAGAWVWRWKDGIDRRFMRRYRV